MHYTEMTILWCITTWKNQPVVPPMQHQSSLFKEERGAWKSLTSQYAGQDKWEAEIKHQEQLLHTRVWKGQSNFSLENFISQHRNINSQMNTEELNFYLKQFNALTLNSKLPWQVSRLTMALKA